MNKILTNITYFFFLIFFYTLNSFSSNLKFEGISKLNLNDIQSLTSFDIDKKILNEQDLDTIIKELYSSDLIYNVSFQKFDKNYIFTVVENQLIENIYINGNIRLDDNQILPNLFSKNNFFLDKNKVLNDVSLIKNYYFSLGFNDISISTITEKYSDDRINLIFEINEGNQSKISHIKFIGNLNFSNNYLLSIINSKSNNIYNIFTSGSNFDESIFKFDVSKIKSLYQDYGYFDADISYSLSEITSSRYSLKFYISEGNRYDISDISFEFSDNIISSNNKTINEFETQLENNKFYFDENIFVNFINNLRSNSLSLDMNIDYTYDLEFTNSSIKVIFKQTTSKPKIINKINIYGNSITKDKTIRSRLSFQPGDIYNQNIIDVSKKRISRLKYINNIKLDYEELDESINVNLDLVENQKTGSFLFGGSFSGDMGLGVGFSIKDYNILGSGNEIDTTFNINSEQALFNLKYSSHSLNNPLIKNNYSIFNLESDLTDSFGYKLRKSGLGYSIDFNYSNFIFINTGFKYEYLDGYSPINNSAYISDNINKFSNFIYEFVIKSDKTNDFLYPSSGSSNRFYLKLSPEKISDDSYYKFTYDNEIYFDNNKSTNFFFVDNSFGFSESLGKKLKTSNAFSLGGLNFKGFDYRGIGPFDNKVYLGGNKYFTSTIGYGTSFIFDDKDNMKFKIFYTTGSLWDSDYVENDDIDIRSSLGLSFDILTAVGPISLSYSVPLDKNDSDRTKSFNFSIGTSF